MKATFFASPAHFRKWLEKNHKAKKEILVGYYKVGTKTPSITWPQSVEQALCFGWIDGIRRTIDDKSYCIRFTPRRKNSTWSDINIKLFKKLFKAGLIKTQGNKVFEERKSQIKKTPSKQIVIEKLSPNYEKRFKQNKNAWTYFKTQAPSYKKIIINWIMNAKQEKTRESRLLRVINDCESKKSRR